MKTITFKQFKSNYEQYYNEKLTSIRYEELDEVIFDLFNTYKYEFDYDNKTIELY